jgi:hypothetical protein
MVIAMTVIQHRLKLFIQVPLKFVMVDLTIVNTLYGPMVTTVEYILELWVVVSVLCLIQTTMELLMPVMRQTARTVMDRLVRPIILIAITG